MTAEPALAELRPLLQRALLLRVGVAVLLHLFSLGEIFAPDEATYQFFSAWLARYWAGDTLVYPWKLTVDPKGYYHILAALYFVFGEWSLLPKLLNAAAGTLTVRLVYDVAERISGRPGVGLRAATYTAYFPSLILWSALNIRDCWVVLLIVLISREALKLQAASDVRSLALLVGSVLTITQFREYIFMAVAAPVVVSFLVRNQAHVLRNAAFGMLLATVVIYGQQAIGSGTKLKSLDLETLQQVRQGTAAGGSQFAASADISTPGKALLFLPIGLSYFLLAPFPWTITNPRQAFTLPEMLFFYSLVPAIVQGILHLVRHCLSRALMILLVTAGLTFGYALGQANVGTAYRHRAQVLSFYLIFAAVGVETRRRPETPVEDTA
jgi:hypothetical protein